MKPDLLILGATSFEVSCFLSLCPGQSERLTRAGQSVISGSVGSASYDLLITGPGVFNTAHALTAYIEQVPSDKTPKLILQTGIAGVFKQSGLHIGDLAIATSEHYIHIGVESGSPQLNALPFDLIKEKLLTRTGVYPFDQTRVDNAFEILKNQSINIQKGPFATVSTITASFDTAARIFLVRSPLMENMEGAACAHIAALYDIPMIEIRAASNFAGERDKSNWDIDLAIKQLGLACAAMIKA